MQEFDLVITGGTIATASDTFQCDIGISDGKIAALGTGLKGAEVIDATGKYVLPGGIDSHVHIAQPSSGGIVMADDFESGTRSALFGGNTTVLPFCLQQKGQTIRQALNDYHAKQDGECYTDVSFHLIITDPTPEVLGQELPAAFEDGYKSFKVFMTYEDMRLNDAELLQTFDVARDFGATVMIHCENEDAIKFLIEKHEAAGKLRPTSHATTRPVAVEREVRALGVTGEALRAARFEAHRLMRERGRNPRAKVFGLLRVVVLRSVFGSPHEEQGGDRQNERTQAYVERHGRGA